MVAVSGKLFAIGGVGAGGSEAMSSCESYSAVEGRWVEISSMNHPRSSFAAVVVPLDETATVQPCSLVW